MADAPTADDPDRVIWRSWRSGMSLRATVLATKRAGCPQTIEHVRAVFVALSERFG